MQRAVHALLAAFAALPAVAPAQVYNWASGTYTPGITGPATLLAGETLNINNGGFKYFDTISGTFTVQGTVNWNADALYLQGTSRIVNQSLWLSWADTTLAWNGGTPSFLNTGTFRKSGGSGATTVQAGLGFVNQGTIEAASGRIDFLGGTRFEAGSVFAAGGDVRLVSGTHTLAGAYTSAGSLLLASGSFVGEGAVAQGTTRWTGGFVSGSFSNAAGAEWVVGNGNFKYVQGASTVFTNDGTLRWQADPIYVQNGAQLLNRGTWLVESDLLLAYNGGATPAVVNEGLLRKSGGAGSLQIQSGLGFVNRGTLQADSGSLVFLGGSRFESGSVYTGAGQVRLAGNNTLAGAQFSDSLVLAGGNHLGDAAELLGSTRFEGGFLQGGWTVAAGHTLRGVDGSFKYLDGAGTVLANRGTLGWDTGNPLYLQGGAQFVNEGLFVATTTTSLANNGGALPAFRNTATGTVRAAAGQQLVFGNQLMRNEGGLIEAEAGGSVLFNAGATFGDGSRFGGAGLVRVSASAAFAGTQTGVNLQLDGGDFTGDAALIDGTTTFNGGRFTGTWTVAAGSTLVGGSGTFKYLSGAGTVLGNLGRIEWNTGNPWYLEHGARLVNEGVFRAGTSTSLVDNGGADPLLDLRAAGRLEAAAGTLLVVQVPMLSTGTLQAEAGAEIRVLGGARFEGGTRFAGDGRNVAQGSNVFAGALQSANLDLNSGFHTGEAAAVSGTLRFSGGRMLGGWTVASGSELSVGSGAFKYLDGTGGTELAIDGRMFFDGAQALYLESGALLRNRGQLELVSGSVIVDNGGTTPVLRNEGLLVKVADGGAATIGNGVDLRNLGIIDVRSGTLNLPTGWLNEGRLAGNGTLGLTGTLTSQGTVAPGAAAGPSAGTLTVSGALVLGGLGSFEAELGSLAVHDSLLINGPVTLGGTLALACLGNCSYAVGDVITLIDSTGELGGSFADITLSGFATGSFEAIYDTVADRFQLRVTEAVTAVPEPRTAALWLGGLLALGWLRRRRAH